MSEKLIFINWCNQNLYSLNLRLILLTQCLSSVGVGKRSPLNTCPRCPPHLAQQISILCIPWVLSSWRTSAPGILSKTKISISTIYKLSYYKIILTGGPSAIAVKFCIRNIKRCITTSTMINAYVMIDKISRGFKHLVIVYYPFCWIYYIRLSRALPFLWYRFQTMSNPLSC